MPRKLQAYAANWCGKSERLVAASSRAEAARCLGMSESDFRDFGHITGNDDAVKVALANPSIVFERPFTSTGHSSAWTPILPALKVGVEFLHRRRLDPIDTKPHRPLRCVVTALRNGMVYYGPADCAPAVKGDEYAAFHRWSAIAALVPQA